MKKILIFLGIFLLIMYLIGVSSNVTQQSSDNSQKENLPMYTIYKTDRNNAKNDDYLDECSLIDRI